MFQADDRDDLRLLHGRRGRPGHGVRSPLRRRGLEVRHSRRAAEHHLPGRRRSRSSSTWWGRPTPRTSCSRPACSTPEALPSASSSGWCPAADSRRRPTTISRCSPTTRRSRCAARSSPSRPPGRLHATRAARACAPAARLGERGLPRGHPGLPREAAGRVSRSLSPSCGSSSSARRRRRPPKAAAPGSRSTGCGAGSSAWAMPSRFA